MNEWREGEGGGGRREGGGEGGREGENQLWSSICLGLKELEYEMGGRDGESERDEQGVKDRNGARACGFTTGRSGGGYQGAGFQTE